MSRRYFAFTDPSGGAQDSFCLAIAARALFNDQRSVIYVMVERKAPFNPDEIVAKFAGILRSYHLTECTGDRYAAGWVVGAFAAEGIRYVPSQLSKSEIYQQFAMLLSARRVRLPLNRRLRAQFLALERRTRSGGSVASA
jgi:hypothetical protein